MLPTHRSTSRFAHSSRLDRAAVTLLRLVTDGRAWDPEAAALDLREQLADERLLHLLRARVAHAMLERPTHTDTRALATLDRALGPWARPARSEGPLMTLEAATRG